MNNKHHRLAFCCSFSLASPLAAGGWNLSVADAVDAHLKFWDLFTAAELNFFGDKDKEGENKVRMGRECHNIAEICRE